MYAHNRWFRFYGSSPRPMAQAERFYDDSAVTQELRLVSNGENKVDWTVGAYYTDQDSDLGQNSYLVGYIPYLNAYPYGCAPPDFGWYCIGPYTTEQDFLFRRSQDYKETAVYGEFTINFTDDVHLTLGGRYFDNDIDVDALVDVPIYAVFAPPGTASEKRQRQRFPVQGQHGVGRDRCFDAVRDLLAGLPPWRLECGSHHRQVRGKPGFLHLRSQTRSTTTSSGTRARPAG